MSLLTIACHFLKCRPHHSAVGSGLRGKTGNNLSLLKVGLAQFIAQIDDIVQFITPQLYRGN